MNGDQELQAALSRITALARSRNIEDVALHASGLLTGETRFAELIGPHTLMLHCPLEQKALLLQASPAIYFETDAHIGAPVVLVHLDSIADEELALRLEDAWRFCTEDRE